MSGPRSRRWPQAALLVGALSLAACGSSSTPSTGTTTTEPGTTTTTTAASATCTTFGSMNEVTGATAVRRDPPIALLQNVQVQAERCRDEVAFDVMGGTPGWSVAYADGPLTEDPSGRPVVIGGAEALVVRLEPAAGADLAATEPVTTYDGPTTLHPAAPSEVVEVHQIGDFEAVTSWAIGLPERRPFEVTVTDEQIIVAIAAPRPRETRCDLPGGAGVRIGYPAGWFGEMSDRWACQYFDPARFVVHPATNDFRWAVTVQLADVGYAGVLDRLRRTGSGTASVDERGTNVAGHPATVVDAVSDGAGLLPAGMRWRQYVVDIGARALVLTGAPGADGPAATARAEAVDELARLVRTTP